MRRTGTALQTQPRQDQDRRHLRAGRVVRNLSLRESEKGLSTGEKQMFTRTKKILASELMYALDKDEEEAESYLDELLADSASQQLAVAGAK
jgi:CarD family transcriptional regulator